MGDKEKRAVMYPVGEPVLRPSPQGHTGEPTPAQTYGMYIGTAIPSGTKLLIRLKDDGLELFDLEVE